MEDVSIVIMKFMVYGNNVEKLNIKYIKQNFLLIGKIYTICFNDRK